MILTLWVLGRRILHYRIVLAAISLGVLLWTVFFSAKDLTVTAEEESRIQRRFKKLLQRILGPAVTWPT